MRHCRARHSGGYARIQVGRVGALRLLRSHGAGTGRGRRFRRAGGSTAGGGSAGGATSGGAAGGSTIRAAQVVAGRLHSCLLTTTGAVQCWGAHEVGQLGTGATLSTTTYPTPQPLPAITSGATALSSSIDHTCAIVSGSARCWGRNGEGQLGNLMGGTPAAGDRPHLGSHLPRGERLLLVRRAGRRREVLGHERRRPAGQRHGRGLLLERAGGRVASGNGDERMGWRWPRLLVARDGRCALLGRGRLGPTRRRDEQQLQRAGRRDRLPVTPSSLGPSGATADSAGRARAAGATLAR